MRGFCDLYSKIITLPAGVFQYKCWYFTDILSIFVVRLKRLKTEITMAVEASDKNK